MTRQDTVMLKHIILSKLSDLVGDQRLREKLAEPDEKPIETIERVHVEIERNLVLSLRKRFDDHSRELEEALVRINNNTYGRCLDCGKEISVKRLMVQPTTWCCVNCQSARERDFYRQKEI